MTIHVFIRHEFEKMGTGIVIADIDEASGKIKVARPTDLVFEDIDAAAVVDSTLFFRGQGGEQFLNGLANALVSLGFRPDELKASNKEVEAMKYHLEDMRSLVFDGKRK